MSLPLSRILGHTITITLDHQRGGWMASCSCGWQAKRATFYKARALGFAQSHLEETQE